MLHNNFQFSCLKKGCSHKLKGLFSANTEEVRVEITTVGHNEDVHSADSLLTPLMKPEIATLAESLKPAKIRLKLFVRFKLIFNKLHSFLGKVRS